MHDRDIEILQERIARLSANLAVIRVGAYSEPALKERFRRTEGSLAATQAAISEGWSRVAVRPCCGRRNRSMRSSSPVTTRVARRSSASVLSEPLYWIASNAGYDGQAAIDQVRRHPPGTA